MVAGKEAILKMLHISMMYCSLARLQLHCSSVSCQRLQGSSWAKQLPPVLLLHGDSDSCAPIHNAEQFAAALEEAGASIRLKRYSRQTHTSPLIENPMRGGRDILMDDILAAVTDQEEVFTRQLPLCPSFLIRLAALVCPF